MFGISSEEPQRTIENDGLWVEKTFNNRFWLYSTQCHQTADNKNEHKATLNYPDKGAQDIPPEKA